MIPFKQSPNYHTGRYAKIKYIVLHAMVGWYKYTTETLFMSPGHTSAHYCISQKGDVLQMVKDQDTAFHVCRANPFCIGIEHEDGGNCMKNGAWITSELYQASVKLTAQLCIKWAVPTCNIIGHENPLLHQYGNDHVDPGPFFNIRRYQLDVQKEIDRVGVLPRIGAMVMRMVVPRSLSIMWPYPYELDSEDYVTAHIRTQYEQHKQQREEINNDGT